MSLMHMALVDHFQVGKALTTISIACYNSGVLPYQKYYGYNYDIVVYIT